MGDGNQSHNVLFRFSLGLRLRGPRARLAGFTTKIPVRLRRRRSQCTHSGGEKEGGDKCLEIHCERRYDRVWQEDFLDKFVLFVGKRGQKTIGKLVI
jgi:hypothetical protein